MTARRLLLVEKRLNLTPFHTRLIYLASSCGKITISLLCLPQKVSLQYAIDDFHFCGGAIVNADTVLTTGFCCDGNNAEELNVVAGDHNLFINEGTEQIVAVDKIIIHPDYDIMKLNNDVCILKLASSLELNEYVKGITLPTEHHQEFEGTATVSGWGTLTYIGGELSDTLHAADVSIVTDASCMDSYNPEFITNSMICAGSKRLGSCIGDTGGPLTCGGVHCGITSMAFGCVDEEHPGVFTQTSYFLDFIKTNS